MRSKKKLSAFISRLKTNIGTKRQTLGSCSKPNQDLPEHCVFLPVLPKIVKINENNQLKF